MSLTYRATQVPAAEQDVSKPRQTNVAKRTLPVLTELQSKELKTWALVCVILHSILALSAIIVGILPDGSQYQVGLQWWRYREKSVSVDTPITWNLCFASAAFALLSAMFHMITLANWDHYISNLSFGNPYRWAEYSLSASVMAVSIAVMIGVRELATLILVFGAHMAIMWAGLALEISKDRFKLKDEDSSDGFVIIKEKIPNFGDYRPKMYKWLFELGVWVSFIVIMVANWVALLGVDPLSRVPLVAWFTIIGMMFTFTSFGLWQVFAMHTDGMTFFTYELGYYLLSVFAKTQLFAYVLWGAFGNKQWLSMNDVVCGLVNKTV